jgi:polyhydroxyalkanoate synthesis regulator protein
MTMMTPEYYEHDMQALRDQRDRLRAALAALVGMDGREDLEQMEAVMRLTPAPLEDRAHAIDAIHALLATLP